MSVFDPFHHDHINTPVNTPLITPFELQMIGGCRMKTGGYNPPGGVWINHCVAGLKGIVGRAGNEARHEMGMGQDGEKGERRKEKEGNGRKERAYLRRSAGNIGPLASHRHISG